MCARGGGVIRCGWVVGGRGWVESERASGTLELPARAAPRVPPRTLARTSVVPQAALQHAISLYDASVAELQAAIKRFSDGEVGPVG